MYLKCDTDFKYVKLLTFQQTRSSCAPQNGRTLIYIHYFIVIDLGLKIIEAEYYEF